MRLPKLAEDAATVVRAGLYIGKVAGRGIKSAALLFITPFG